MDQVTDDFWNGVMRMVDRRRSGFRSMCAAIDLLGKRQMLLTKPEQKRVPGTIDCLSDVFVLGFWRVLLDFYAAVWEEWLRLSVSRYSGSNCDRNEIVVAGNGFRTSFSVSRPCMIRIKKGSWYKRLPM